jgi:hypothetical protein
MSAGITYNGKVVYIRATFDQSTMVLVSYKKKGAQFKVQTTELIGYTEKK